METYERLVGQEITDSTSTVSNIKVELAMQLFDSMEKQVQLADRKVQAVFGLNAFLVAAISLQNQQSFNSLVQQGISATIVTDLALKIVFLTCVCIATWSAIQALTPRGTKKKILTKRKPSLFFFGDIRTQPFKQFSDTFLGLSNEEAVKELLESVHVISGILATKYKLLQRSSTLLSVALLLWILLQVNKFFG